MKSRILLIDDNEDMGAMVTNGLKKIYDVDFALDGYTAQQLIGRKQYDLILCDIRMPFLNGITLVEEFRKKDINIPVIFVSAEISDEVSKQAFQLGASNLVSKPFQMKELKDKIKAALTANSHENDEGDSETSEMTRGHIYNQLKTFYYDYEKMIYFIQANSISLNLIGEELDKKEHTGRCMLDDPNFLLDLKSKKTG